MKKAIEHFILNENIIRLMGALLAKAATRGGSRGGLRRSPVAAATALSRSCSTLGQWEGLLGGGCYSRLKGEEETETGTTAAAA